MSPVRIAVRISGYGLAGGRDASAADLSQRLLQVAVDVGAERLERRDIDDRRALLQPASPAASATSRSRQLRKAASVLPDPVGAEMSTSPPARIRGHASSCAGGGGG